VKTKYTVALAMLAGVGLGAAAIQALHAQAKPLAYVIVEATVTDQDPYMKEFVPVIVKTVKDAGGKFLVSGGKTLALSGAPPAPRIIVVQFDNLDKVQAWGISSAYKSAMAIGQKYGNIRQFAVEGLPQ
jgi:uncharacterized protein (DUF1330 family)